MQTPEDARGAWGPSFITHRNTWCSKIFQGSAQRGMPHPRGPPPRKKRVAWCSSCGARCSPRTLSAGPAQQRHAPSALQPSRLGARPTQASWRRRSRRRRRDGATQASRARLGSSWKGAGGEGREARGCAALLLGSSRPSRRSPGVCLRISLRFQPTHQIQPCVHQQHRARCRARCRA